MYIIAWGNPADGMEFIWPFPTHENALDFAESDLNSESEPWHIIALQTPKIPYLPSSNDDPGLTTTKE